MPIGLVLAGGLGKRMGASKGALPAPGGGTLALRAARTLAPLCAGVLISVRAGGPNPAPGFAAVEDPPPAGRGPLAGIAAAFEAVGAVDLLVLACDYPRAEQDLLGRILELASPSDAIVFPVDGRGRDHPLCGLWRGPSAAAVAAALGRGRHAVHEVVSGCPTSRLDASRFPGLDLERQLLNLNYPGDG